MRVHAPLPISVGRAPAQNPKFKTREAAMSKIGHRFEFAIYCRVGPHTLLLVTGLLLQKDTAVIAYRIINGTERDTIIKFDCAILPESVRSTFVLAGLFFLEKAEEKASSLLSSVPSIDTSYVERGSISQQDTLSVRSALSAARS